MALEFLVTPFGHLRIVSVALLNTEAIVLAIVLNPELPRREATLDLGVYLNVPAFSLSEESNS